MPPGLVNDSVHWFMSELASRVVAESGIPGDRYHLGKLILQSFKDAPDFVMQIDGATGESENFASILERSVRCATSFASKGLQTGDVIVLMAPNHVDLAVPFYAAIYLGVIVAAVDRTLGVVELQNTFNVIKPKLIFCQSEKAPQVQVTLNELESEADIVTFDKGDYLLSLAEFLEKYEDPTPVEEFRPVDYDPAEAVGFLIATSGTTGLPKSAAVTYKNFCITTPYLWSRYSDFPSPTSMVMIGAPLQWLTALFHYIISPVLRYTRLQTSHNVTQDHAYYLINTYRPTFTILSPTLMTTLMKPGERDQCDFTCFEQILLGGSAVPPELVQDIKLVSPNTEVLNAYGMSEITSIAFHGENLPPGSPGKPMGCLRYRIINLETMEDINEPNVPGELWLKGPGIFKEYYDNPAATEETFAEDRWFKTGDMFYRDENWNFFFLERIKLLLKYKSYQISPVEIEGVIRQYPGVFDVAVTGIADPECGDLPVACIVKNEGEEFTAQNIKDFVAETLSDAKQLRGGVIFVDAIPMTASTKVHRRKLKEMVLEMERE